MEARGWRRPRRFAVAHRFRAPLQDLTHRTRQVLLLAAVTGAVTGVFVAGFERLTADVLLAAVLDAPLAVQVIAPAVGLVVAFWCLRLAGRTTTPSTADEYIRSFHDRSHRLDLRPVPARILAAIATLGAGGPLGYEGPSLYGGAAIGSWIQRRRPKAFAAEDAKVLLVAGAAAGVAAIFKAPVTGLVFALEVPYQEDLARRMLLPAAISAAASYVTFAAIAGTEPILPIAGQPPFDLRDLGGAAVVGLVAGCLARVFLALIRHAKTFVTRTRPAVRVGAGGALLAATVLAAHAIDDSNLALGPGYDALRWAMDPDRALMAIVALGTLRAVGAAAVVGGGGTGGLFIPLVIQGAFVGRAVGGLFGADETTLFPVVGMAAFLGAGYRVPLAAVVFVAEATGRPGFVVPGLIAAVVAQLVMGRASISPYQVAGRVGHLEGRLQMPLRTVVDTDARTVPPDATVEELFWQHLVASRQQSVAVVDEATYLGVASTEAVRGLDRDAWASTRVAEIMRTDLPVASPDWLLRDAVAAMEQHDTDRLAVCDGGGYVGVITANDLVELDEVIGITSPEP
ncbi:MAG: chloride channel protein [Acidimicrobiales bacterium]